MYLENTINTGGKKNEQSKLHDLQLLPTGL